MISAGPMRRSGVRRGNMVGVIIPTATTDATRPAQRSARRAPTRASSTVDLPERLFLAPERRLGCCGAHGHAKGVERRFQPQVVGLSESEFVNVVVGHAVGAAGGDHLSFPCAARRRRSFPMAMTRVHGDFSG